MSGFPAFWSVEQTFGPAFFTGWALHCRMSPALYDDSEPEMFQLKVGTALCTKRPCLVMPSDLSSKNLGDWWQSKLLKVLGWSLPMCFNLLFASQHGPRSNLVQEVWPDQSKKDCGHVAHGCTISSDCIEMVHQEASLHQHSLVIENNSKCPPLRSCLLHAVIWCIYMDQWMIYDYVYGLQFCNYPSLKMHHRRRAAVFVSSYLLRCLFRDQTINLRVSRILNVSICSASGLKYGQQFFFSFTWAGGKESEWAHMWIGRVQSSTSP